MTSLYAKLCEFLDADEWNFHKFPDEQIVRAIFSTSGIEWDVLGVAREETEQIIFYSLITKTTTPKGREREVCNLLNLLNCRTVYGSFEMEGESGEVMFRTALDLADVTPPMELIRNSLYTNLTSMEQYHEAIVAVMSEEFVTAELALAVIDGESE